MTSGKQHWCTFIDLRVFLCSSIKCVSQYFSIHQKCSFVDYLIDHKFVLSSGTNSILTKQCYFRQTYNLGKQKGFNNWLGGNETKFTYFVPTDEAWLQLKYNHPSYLKTLTDGSNPYLTQHLLERHLVVGTSLGLKDLVSQKQVIPYQK